MTADGDDRSRSCASPIVEVAYGEARALFGVSFDVRAGSVTTVLGANGAGKSSLASAIAGVVKPSAGRIEFDGDDITGWTAHRISKLGLAFVPESRQHLPPPLRARQPVGADPVHR